ncbi:Protein-glutamate methylesterase/protein-glutamine glutaminase [Desulfonema limicola]|uniref:Protein-glutamate methylesterase/protein-glutamine glutaminase n=1 Tax=Desulfonema limicola TaxID=45656 RepID=A0A975BB41_9BACT|nr:chemotaxis-specific protein-glutamate methyltransferase CheB [Desulfonema limicola]QTA82101.1 Protein-glutamate methylesterase/protein-glutamine glutaminase [Desulfonema limicola]
MKPIRVLIVDDSIFAREFIADLLSNDKDIQIAGHAGNGYEAIQKAAKLKPDIITMDIDMPAMDGLESIKHIMQSNAVPILVVTSKTDIDTAYHAISNGALEIVEKPGYDTGDYYEFINKIKLLSKVRVIPNIHYAKKPVITHSALKDKTRGSDKIIAIASSTGGPRALSLLLTALPPDFEPPVVIAQHIADDFAEGMAQWLDKVVKLKVRIGKPGDIIKPGNIYLSQSEKHMKIDTRKRIALQDRSPQDIYFPSGNVLLSSAGRVYKKDCIGIILTGMGDDGTAGIRTIKESGGTTIAQDENSSVIFGMPKKAIESGFIDKVLPIDKIAQEILCLVKN